MRKKKVIYKPARIGARLTPVAYQNLTLLAADYAGNRSKALTALLEQWSMGKTKSHVSSTQDSHVAFQG